MTGNSADQTMDDDYFAEDVATFGDRLEAARLARGMSLNALAKNLGVDRKTLSAWENDQSEPRANRIQMLAAILNVSMVWLISGFGNGTQDVQDSVDRRDEINQALAELTQIKRALNASLKRVSALEELLKN